MYCFILLHPTLLESVRAPAAAVLWLKNILTNAGWTTSQSSQSMPDGPAQPNFFRGVSRNLDRAKLASIGLLPVSLLRAEETQETWRNRETLRWYGKLSHASPIPNLEAGGRIERGRIQVNED